MPQPPITGKNSSQVNIKDLEIESIDFFVRMMSLLGMPKSVGEIYGLLYFSPSALSMEHIVKHLGISIGSASQGLKTLRSLKAVRTSYVPGDRRDHYLAETEFRRLFTNFIKDEIMPHMDSAKERIERMESSLPPLVMSRKNLQNSNRKTQTPDPCRRLLITCSCRFVEILNEFGRS